MINCHFILFEWRLPRHPLSLRAAAAPATLAQWLGTAVAAAASSLWREAPVSGLACSRVACGRAGRAQTSKALSPRHYASRVPCAGAAAQGPCVLGRAHAARHAVTSGSTLVP